MEETFRKRSLGRRREAGERVLRLGQVGLIQHLSVQLDSSLSL
jgi:hypothetical protein